MSYRSRLFGIVAALLIAPMLISPAAAGSAKVVIVYANKLWKNTLINIHAGDPVTIRATGTWSWSDMESSGPDGDPTDDYNAFDLFEPFDFFSQGRLIAFIGPDPKQGHWGDGSFFPQQSGYISIGSGQTFTAPYSGRLWLGMNDGAETEGIGDNKGIVHATITVGSADTTAPTITITAPTGAYAQNRVVQVQYSCSDAGNGVASCVGPVANGGTLDTSTAGHHAFTVVATDNSGNVSSQTVGYAVGDSSTAVVTPTGGAFPPAYIGTKSLVQQFSLTNTTGSILAINGVSVTDDENSEFHIYGTACGATLQPHQSCKISVFFKPTVAGVESALLHVDASATVVDVPLWSLGTEVRVAPDALAFPDQAVSTTSAPMTVMLTNSQTTFLSITEIAATGDFAVDPSTTCPRKGKLALGKSCNIAVTFTPSQSGARTGTLVVHGSATIDPFAVALSGNGAP